MNEDIFIPCLSNRSRMRGMPSYTPYSKNEFVGKSGSPCWIGSGMTPPAPEIGWPPASNIREKLTARRALFGQNEIGRASCRERVERAGGGAAGKKKEVESKKEQERR